MQWCLASVHAVAPGRDMAWVHDMVLVFV